MAAKTDSAQLAPATYKAALRRLERSAVGRLFHFARYDGGHFHLADVYPIAWAISRLAPGAKSIAVMHDGVDADTQGRWYSLVPILLGAHKRVTVDILIGRSNDQDLEGVPGPMRVLAAPRHNVRELDDLSLADRPDVLVLIASEENDALLEELAHPRIRDWMAAGTAVILMAETDAYLALVAAAIDRLDGACGEIAHRLSPYQFARSREHEPATGLMVVACRLTRAPALREGWEIVAQQLERHLDLLVETNVDADIDGDGPDVRFAVIGTCFAPIANVDDPDAQRTRSITLPGRKMYLTGMKYEYAQDQPLAVILDADFWMASAERMLSGDASRRPRPPPPIPVDERHQATPDITNGATDAVSIRLRYCYALSVYQLYIHRDLLTVFGRYRLAGDGYLDELDDDGNIIPVDPLHRASATLLEFAPSPEASDHQPSSEAASPDRSETAGDEAAVELLATDGAGEGASSTESTALEPASLDVQRDDLAAPTTDAAPDSDELARLRMHVAELRARLDKSEAQKRQALSEVAALREQLAGKQTEALEASAHRAQHKAAAAQASAGDVAGLPSTWDELFDWTHRRYPDEIHFTSRARRAARKSAYRDVPLVAQSIALLCDDYRRVKIEGGDDARAALEERCKSLRVTVGPTGAAPSDHRTAELYQASLDGKRYALDMHVQGSSSRDPTKSLRIYFAWLPDRRQILVGHLPGHLRNSLS